MPVPGKDQLLIDLYIVEHHLESSRDREVIKDVRAWIDSDVESMTYTSRYPECIGEVKDGSS